MEGGGGAKGWGHGRTEIGGNVSNGSAAVAVGARATRELKDAPPTNASNGKPAIKRAAIRPGRVFDESANGITFWGARFFDVDEVKSRQVKSSQVQISTRPPPLGRPPAREIGRARRGATGMAG